MSRRSFRLKSSGYYNSDEESDSSSVTNISYRENPVKYVVPFLCCCALVRGRNDSLDASSPVSRFKLRAIMLIPNVFYIVYAKGFQEEGQV